MTRQKSTVLVVTLVAITLMLIISVSSLVMTTSQARLCEHQVRRIKAIYAAEAGLVHALERLRNGTFDVSGLETINIDNMEVSLNWTEATGTINATVEY